MQPIVAAPCEGQNEVSPRSCVSVTLNLTVALTPRASCSYAAAAEAAAAAASVLQSPQARRCKAVDGNGGVECKARMNAALLRDSMAATER